MSITKSLRNLVIECGGTPTAKTFAGLLGEVAVALGGSGKGKTVAEQIDNIVDAKNPLNVLTVDTTFGDYASDLLGKAASDLQSNIAISADGKVTGTLKYVTGYTGFSGLEEEQSGNYLAFHYSVPNVTGVTIKVGKKRPVILDADGIHILRIVPTGSMKITVTATKDGHVPFVKTYDISGLTLEGEDD